MNRTFIGISCNDSLPYTLINTRMVADTRTSAGGHIHTHTVEKTVSLFLMLNPLHHPYPYSAPFCYHTFLSKVPLFFHD